MGRQDRFLDRCLTEANAERAAPRSTDEKVSDRSHDAYEAEPQLTSEVAIKRVLTAYKDKDYFRQASRPA